MKKTTLICLMFLSVFIDRINAQDANIDQIFNKKLKGTLISSDDNFPSSKKWQVFFYFDDDGNVLSEESRNI